MPLLENPLEDLNRKLGSKGELNDEEIQAIRGATTFLGLFQAVGAVPGGHLVQYMEAWPRSLQHSVVAAVGEAAGAGIPVSAMYNPGYDFRVEMEESASTDQSSARLSILVIGPYPQHVANVRPWIAQASQSS
jgi:hypothetical protein